MLTNQSCSFTFEPAPLNMLMSDTFGKEGGTYVVDVKPEFLKYFLVGSECSVLSYYSESMADHV
jgi:hypothetical protein